MEGKDNYSLLLSKLDSFIRKYYINKLIRGGLYCLGLVLVLFLLFNFLESQFYFGTGPRKLMFFSFISVSLASFIYWVVIPLTKYFHLGQTISHERAAEIIGSHFYDVKDKLLNVLQLKKQSDSYENRELILASINQKSESIKLVPFQGAIDLTHNKKYLKYTLTPFLLLLVMLFAAPSMIKDSSYRIIHNNDEFERDAPFHFTIENEELKVVQYDDYNLVVNVDGTALPNDVFIDVDNYQYRLQKINQNTFEYQFKNVQKSSDFHLYSGFVKSIGQTLTVLEKPNLANFNIYLDYPSYVGRKDETLNNTGNLIIPAGTTVKWTFNTLYTDDIGLGFSNNATPVPAERQGENEFYYKKKLLKDQLYKIYISNKNIPNADSISYAINVIPDNHPTINVEKFQDSSETNLVYFVGGASDDYGLRDLSFNYQLKNERGVMGELVTQKLNIPKGSQIQYDHTFDITDLNLKAGEEVSFYFEVFDNDAVNGSKSARTGLMSFAKPSIEELKEKEELNNEQIKDELEKAIKESKKIREEMKKLREKLLQEKELEWQDKKELEKLMERHNEMQKQIEKAKEKFDENLNNQKEMNQPQDQTEEKQEKLQELFEEAIDPEMQDLMDQIQELMEELNKEEMMEMMESFEMNEESQEKEMDRLLELFKQLEVEKDIQDQIEKLNELAEKEEELADKTEKSENSDKSEEEAKKENEELKKEQEDINKEFEDVKEKMDEIEKKNEELEFPKEMGDDNEEQMEEIQEELDDSKEQLEKQDNKKASEAQKKASQKMKNMASNMQMQMEAGEMEQMQEDMKALRQLLENLVTLSFDQEDLVDEFGSTVVNTPRYIALVQNQFKLKDDFRLIEDSLTALAKRIVQIEAFVTEKATEVKENLKKSINNLEERQLSDANNTQRITMKNVNDLALMLNESMNQMQQQMAGMMAGSQMCKKPGGQGQGKSGNVPVDKITEGQNELNKEMKGMMEGKQKGNKPSSKEFAQAAAKQSALRKALQEMQNSKLEKGQGSKELQEAINQMDKIEIDLVNKRLNNEMLKRQQEIITRLLEADKADREREYDNKRKAEVAKEQKRKLPPALEQYLKERESEVEMYKTVSPALRPYYKQLVEKYYQALKNGK
jgi:hypothetical protein